MGFLDKFEKGVENVANRAMSRFSDDVEPIEIASKLRETMDKRAASFARDRSVVPNVFRIHLAPSDVERLRSWGEEEMVTQMQDVATTHAGEQGYSFVGPVEVSFVEDDALTAPTIEIESSTRRGAAAPAAGLLQRPDGPLEHPVRDLAGGADVLVAHDRDVADLRVELRLPGVHLGELGDERLGLLGERVELRRLQRHHRPGLLRRDGRHGRRGVQDEVARRRRSLRGGCQRAADVERRGRGGGRDGRRRGRRRRGLRDGLRLVGHGLPW